MSKITRVQYGGEIPRAFRGHVRSDGLEKYPYPTEEKAMRAVEKIKNKFDQQKYPYLCTVCSKYHVGS